MQNSKVYKLSYFQNVPVYPDTINKTNQSHFIHFFTKKWDDIHNNSDVFRYKINNLKEKVVNDTYLLQLNPNRSSKRRTPEQIDNICQPFDPEKFNFTKISPEEIIFNLIDDDDDSNIHTLFVNVSPISRYHSLLCPSIAKCLPQIVTEESLLLVTKIMFLGQNRDMRIGFNSLCALASVNHLHYHIFLEKNVLPIESARCTHLHKHIYILTDYPIPGFCFEITEKATIIKEIYKLVQWLLEKSIAHNIMMTRGHSMLGGEEEVLRVIVWPRKSSAGVKQLTAFNVAVCELSGWFPVFNAADFENLQSKELENELRKWKIDNFKELCDEIKLNI